MPIQGLSQQISESSQAIARSAHDIDEVNNSASSSHTPLTSMPLKSSRSKKKTSSELVHACVLMNTF